MELFELKLPMIKTIFTLQLPNAFYSLIAKKLLLYLEISENNPKTTLTSKV